MTITEPAPPSTTRPSPPPDRGPLRSALSDMRFTLVVAGGVVVATALAVVIGLAVNPSTTGSTVQATTVDFSIQMPTTLSSGPHTIHLTNAGDVGHEIVIFKTDQQADALPLKDGDVDEEALHTVADSGDALAPGQTTSFTTADLTPGHYVAVCNLTGHYAAGMRMDLTVK